MSVEALLEHLLNESAASIRTDAAHELPTWRLGEVGSLHRRDLYDDVG
jgi:hypothetical protein